MDELRIFAVDIHSLPFWSIERWGIALFIWLVLSVAFRLSLPAWERACITLKSLLPGRPAPEMGSHIVELTSRNSVFATVNLAFLTGLLAGVARYIDADGAEYYLTYGFGDFTGLTDTGIYLAGVGLLGLFCMVHVVLLGMQAFGPVVGPLWAVPYLANFLACMTVGWLLAPASLFIVVTRRITLWMVLHGVWVVTFGTIRILLTPVLSPVGTALDNTVGRRLSRIGDRLMRG